MFHKFTTVSPAGLGDAIVECFVCGGAWFSTPEDSHAGFSRGYVNAIGDDAPYCSGNSGQYHHYPNECSCPDECVADAECECISCR
jgi:hypothetical protein